MNKVNYKKFNELEPELCEFIRNEIKKLHADLNDVIKQKYKTEFKLFQTSIKESIVLTSICYLFVDAFLNYREYSLNELKSYLNDFYDSVIEIFNYEDIVNDENKVNDSKNNH